MPITRRDLLKAGASATALAAIPRPLFARIGRTPEPAPPIQDPRLKELALRAIDTARSSGATYADVRLTHTRTRNVRPGGFATDAEAIVVGTRALVDGYWGFASGPVWSTSEMVRLGREAVHQAKTNTLGKSRLVELAPVPAVRDGHWVMPVTLDPFEISPFEIGDYLKSLEIFAERTPGVSAARNGCGFVVQDKAFASTEDSYCTQRLYRTAGTFEISVTRAGKMGGGALDYLTPAGLGWELYRGQPLREYIRKLIAEVEEDIALPVKRIEVGRYDTVFDALSVARLLDQTIGRATELDRALGYEANAGGTSYISDPLAVVGSYQAGATALTVTANRSESGGVATAKWDDEGVTPDEFTILKNGVLADFQTTRESAGWLKESYARLGTPLRSHGCASAPSALEVPLTHPPNFTMVHGRETLDFDALVSGLRTGIAVRGAQLDMDFQNLNGLLTGRFYEVKQGKRVAHLGGAGLLFRAPELWKGLLAIGGGASQRRYGEVTSKGEPAQSSYHSVTAVPVAFKQLTVIDVMRKA